MPLSYISGEGFPDLTWSLPRIIEKYFLQPIEMIQGVLQLRGKSTHTFIYICSMIITNYREIAAGKAACPRANIKKVAKKYTNATNISCCFKLLQQLIIYISKFAKNTSIALDFVLG